MSENTPVEEFSNLSFVDKCKKDPVIPVCFALAVLSIVGAAIYFILPFRTPAMNITLDDFKTSYESTEIYQGLFVNFGVDITPVTYIDTTAAPAEFTGMYTDDNFGELSMTEFDPNCDYFQVALNRDLITLMQGSTRKVDGKITSLRFITKYGGEPTYMTYYYACVLQSLYPSIDSNQAVSLFADLLQKYDINTQGKYTVMGDYAYRLMYIPANGGNYFAFDVVPSAGLKDSDISATIPIDEIVSASVTASETEVPTA